MATLDFTVQLFFPLAARRNAMPCVRIEEQRFKAVAFQPMHELECFRLVFAGMAEENECHKQALVWLGMAVFIAAMGCKVQ